MKKILLWGVGIFWLAIVGFYLVHSSIWATVPKGYVKMIANGNVYQPYDRTGFKEGDCAATRITDDTTKEIFQNTVHAIRASMTAKADMVEIDVASTQDGKMVLFGDDNLECRTNGTGQTKDMTLAELRGLDLGYGLTPDDGQTFPLRGKGTGKVATVEQALGAETYKPFMFNFTGNDPEEADRLVALLKAQGRDIVKEGDGFFGDEAPVKRMRALVPGVWAWTATEGLACAADYKTAGWFGSMPESCKGQTMIVTLGEQWMMAGWPNRTAERVNEAGGHIILAAESDADGTLTGLRNGRQLTKVNGNYKGWLWVDDITMVGPALVR